MTQAAQAAQAAQVAQVAQVGEPKTHDEFDPLVFDMLRAAVNLGRNEQIRTAARLRARLAQVYPEVPADTVESALSLWSDYGRRSSAS